MAIKTNMTVNGINYHLMGNVFVPTAPNLTLEDDIGAAGVAHMKYLQAVHPADFAKLVRKGLLNEYLKLIDINFDLYVQERQKAVTLPAVTDEGYDLAFQRYNCVTSNARCKAENMYIFTSVREDLLKTVTLKHAAAEAARDSDSKSVVSNCPYPKLGYGEWLRRNPPEKQALACAQKSARLLYRLDKRNKVTDKSYEDWLKEHPDIMLSIERYKRRMAYAYARALKEEN
ncbi:MAG: hypothetical protein Q4C54_10465 [Clostridia bacterium]|nr:hypothetical protein [Clostridia bacterium]